MAMITCKECDHKVSDRSSSCPNCGAPVTNKFRRRLWGIVAGGFIILVTLGLIGITLRTFTPESSMGSIGMVHSLFQRSDATPGVGQSSRADAGNPSVYQTTADQLSQDYSANGVATQTRIGQGGIRVSGTIKAIEEDTAGHPVVKLATSRADSAELTLTDDQTAAAAQLVRGQNVEVQCAVMHGIDGRPVGSHCTLALVTAASIAPTLVLNNTVSKPAIVPPTADMAPRSKSGQTRQMRARAENSTRSASIPGQGIAVPAPAQPLAQPTAEAVPEPVPVNNAAAARPSGVTQTTAGEPAAGAQVAAPPIPAHATDAGNPQQPTDATSGSAPVVSAPTVPDDLATVRQADPAAADHIASYCAASAAGANGASFAAGCRRDEKAAWTRLVLNHEFPALDDDTRRICNEPPFPDSYSAKETCARYQLSRTSASAQR